jgi:hypothetical protein
MPKLGDVLFYEKYEYEDGEKSDKLFIVLCSDKHCLVLKTTKNSRRYKDAKEGCNPHKKVFFIPSEKKEFFYLDTYVQFPQIIEIPVQDLLKGAFYKKITNNESALSAKFAQAIKDCLRYFKNDISPVHWDLIFSDSKNSPSIKSLHDLASRFGKK